MSKVFLTGDSDGGWVSGCHQEGYSFEAKVYDNGSRFGIKNGRVSKLYIEADSTGKLVVCYDRGWGLRPAPEVKKVYTDILKFLENTPKHCS